MDLLCGYSVVTEHIIRFLLKNIVYYLKTHRKFQTHGRHTVYTNNTHGE